MVARVTGPTPSGGVLTGFYPNPDGFSSTGEAAIDARAASAVSAHVGVADPHPGYLTPTEANAAYDASGAASAAVAAHAGLADPHAGYRLESALITAADVAADVATQAELDAATADPLAPGSFLIPAGTLGTLPLVNNTLYLTPIPRLAGGHVVAKLGVALTIAGTVGSTSLRYGLFRIDLTVPSTIVLLHECGVLADPTAADTEAAAMLTLAAPFTIPAGVRKVYGAVVLQGAPATSPTVRALTGAGSEQAMMVYPGASMRPGLSRVNITGALPATQGNVAVTTSSPWIIVKTG